LTRQGEQLKTALLASLGHDLRTPPTAVRIAASNKESELKRADQVEQRGDTVRQLELTFSRTFP
jgi:K+-sensing histidine kinase KdpD